MIALPDTRGRYATRDVAEFAPMCFRPVPRLADQCGDPSPWMRDESDVRVVNNRSAWFDALQGGYVVWWIERYMRLYQGRWAGEPAVQHGCKTCLRTWTIPQEFDPDHVLERAAAYEHCIGAGHEVNWQYEFVMRLFGWVRFHPDLQRIVRRFTRGDLWIAKKNMKSPELAFIGWYLTVGDGVGGQNVYFGAKDGQQAKEIVGQHAVSAYLASPELQSCVQHKINEMSFLHWPTRSSMKPLSSSNERTTKSKEGINGLILIDEVHVVDDEFMTRIKRAGISRDEPLVLGVSTAGLQSLGYGKTRQDYGRRVADGSVVDDEYMFTCFEAPQGTLVSELTRDEVLTLGKRANPSWGHTILESEFLSDWNESRQGAADEVYNFGTYRLNLWQHSSAPWIPADKWTKCRDRFELSDLSGRTCSMGLDLSRTYDMSAAVLVFDLDEDGRRPIWPLFWIPENTVRRHQSLIPQMLGWVQCGLLNTTPHDTISHSQVFADLVEVLNQVRCETVYYDPTYADQLTEQLVDRFWLERVAFVQSLKGYTAPASQLEQEILEGVIRHPGHEVLSWQMGHVHVHRNKWSKQMRPVKPSEESKEPRSVDGVQALAMGYCRTLLQPVFDFGDEVML